MTIDSKDISVIVQGPINKTKTVMPLLLCPPVMSLIKKNKLFYFANLIIH